MNLEPTKPLVEYALVDEEGRYWNAWGTGHMLLKCTRGPMLEPNLDHVYRFTVDRSSPPAEIEWFVPGIEGRNEAPTYPFKALSVLIKEYSGWNVKLEPVHQVVAS